MKVLSNGLLILFLIFGLSVPSFAMSVNRDTAYTSTARGLSRYYQPRAVLMDRNRMQQPRNNYVFSPQQARYYGYRGVPNGYGAYGGHGGYRGGYGGYRGGYNGYRGGYGSPYRYR